MTPEPDSSARQPPLQECLGDAQTLWEFHAVGQEATAADVIVCLGSYDVRVAVRCAQMLREDIAPIAVVTGGYGNWTRGEFEQPEAEVFAAVMEGHGVARQWPGIECIVTAPALDLMSQAVDDAGLSKLIEEMVGDVQRLMEYPAAGFQVAVEIPGAVLEAYGRLRARGFDGHCLR